MARAADSGCACFTVVSAHCDRACLKFARMANRSQSDENRQARSVTEVLLDFVFGEPLPQPEVVEHDDEKGWQAWLDAKSQQEIVPEFEDTRPMKSQ